MTWQPRAAASTQQAKATAHQSEEEEQEGASLRYRPEHGSRGAYLEAQIPGPPSEPI